MMRRHPLEPVSLTFGFAFTGLGLLFLFGRADQAIRLHWIWPLLLLVLGAGILLDIARSSSRPDPGLEPPPPHAHPELESPPPDAGPGTPPPDPGLEASPPDAGLEASPSDPGLEASPSDPGLEASPHSSGAADTRPAPSPTATDDDADVTTVDLGPTRDEDR